MKQLAKADAPQDELVLVSQAIEKGMDPQKILDFIDRVNARKAAEAFAAALARFQSECPQILKERLVSFGPSKGGYKFASYDDINKCIAPLLRECGIVITFSIAPDMKGNLLVGTCHVTVGSHTVPTTLPIPIAKGINTNDAQNFGGTLTYLKRYLICAALNIVITDNLEEDKDGVLFITPEEIETLNVLIEKTGTDLQRFLTWAKVETLDQLPQAKFAAAVSMLGKKVKS